MVANQIMMINKPGNEKIVEKASDELSLRMLSSIKSTIDLFSMLHNLFGAIKGKMVIPKTYIHSAKEKHDLIDKELNVFKKNPTLFELLILLMSFRIPGRFLFHILLKCIS